jgi:type IV secretion system protein VirB10
MNTENEKTLAELEEEARQRVRQSSEAKTPAAATKPEQPPIVAMKKRNKSRVMVMCILFLIVLIVLAWVGDFVASSLLSGKKEEPAVVQTPRAAVQRTDMGQDVNPLGTLTEKPGQQGQESQKISETPPVATFDKTAALAPSSGGTGTRQSQQSTSTAPGAPQDTAYTPCPVQLVKDEAGKLVCTAGAREKSEAESRLATTTGVTRLPLNPDLYIPVDMYIPCTMFYRFVSTVAGKISCIISEDVYSASRNTRLIPAGTKARGVYQTGAIKHGEARMFVLWTELRTPDAVIIPLVDSQVVGQLGENGIDGWIDTHFWERFGNAMMLSMVQDTMAGISGQAVDTNSNVDYSANSREAFSEMARTTLENSINIPPTIYKNQGEVIGISTGADIDFSSVYKLRLK